jgi:hypothetical protein
MFQAHPKSIKLEICSGSSISILLPISDLNLPEPQFLGLKKK